MNGLPCRFYCGLSAMTPAQNPPPSLHGPRTWSLWQLLWHIRLCNKLHFLRSGSGLHLCSVKPTDTVERCFLQTPRQTGRWVARQINYSVNCQLSSTADIPFHFHFTSPSAFCLKDRAARSPALDRALPHSSPSLSLAPLPSDRSPVCFSFSSSSSPSCLWASPQDEVTAQVISLRAPQWPLCKLGEQECMLDNWPGIMKRSGVRALGVGPQSLRSWGEERRGSGVGRAENLLRAGVHTQSLLSSVSWLWWFWKLHCFISQFKCAQCVYMNWTLESKTICCFIRWSTCWNENHKMFFFSLSLVLCYFIIYYTLITILARFPLGSFHNMAKDDKCKLAFGNIWHLYRMSYYFICHRN